MESVRAYNMNLKQLIQTEQDHDPINEHGVVTNDNQKTLKADNDVSPLENRSSNGGVQVDISPVWRKAAEEIDLRRASHGEVSALSVTLYNEGAITFEDHINLSFYKDPQNEEPFDVISYWQNQQEKVIQRGAVHEELNDIIRIQSILNYVDSLKY